MGIIRYWLVNNYDLIYREHPKDAEFTGPDNHDYAIVDARVDDFKLDIFNDLKMNSILLIDPDNLVDRNFLSEQGGFDISNFDNDQMFLLLEGAFGRHQFAKSFGNRGALVAERAIGESRYVDNPIEVIESNQQQRTILVYDNFVGKSSYQRSVLAYRQLINLYPDDLIVFAADKIDDEIAVSNRLRLYLSPEQSYFASEQAKIEQYLSSEKFDSAFYFAEPNSDFSRRIVAQNHVDLSDPRSINLDYVFGFPGIYDGSARKNILIDISNFTEDLLREILTKLIPLMNQNPHIFIMLVTNGNSYDGVVKAIEPFVDLLEEPEVYDPDYINMDGSPKTDHEDKVPRFSISVAADLDFEPDEQPSEKYQLLSINYPNLVDLVQTSWIAIADIQYSWLLTGLMRREPVIFFDANQLVDDGYFALFLEYFEITGLTKRTNEKAEMTRIRLEKDEQGLNNEERVIKNNWDYLINGN